MFPHVSRLVKAMIELQLITGMRPEEVYSMRVSDPRMDDEVWTYVPGSHKTEHHGKERIVLLGPAAQEVLRPFLKPDLTAYLFSPTEAYEEYRQRLREQRKSPLTPSQRNRRVKGKHRRKPGECYTREAYRRAIARVCKAAEIPHWHPNQLRHTAATRIRAKYGIEMTRVILGHSSAVTSEIYAEVDQKRVRKAMMEIG